MENQTETESIETTNRDLLLPYCLPYLAYVGIASLSQDRIPVEASYVLKIIIVPLLLYWGWKWYIPVTGPRKISGSIVYGVIFGVAGLGVWCLLMAPFIDLAGEPWTGTGFLLRLFSASLIVPVFEELLIRGYILRVAYQWDMKRRDTTGRNINQKTNRLESKKRVTPLNQALDHHRINDVKPGAWSVMAIFISTIVFAAGHLPVEWVAAIAYSILISVLWIIRKDLLSCMVAHGTTNLTLALYVYLTGHWGFW